MDISRHRSLYLEGNSCCFQFLYAPGWAPEALWTRWQKEIPVSWPGIESRFPGVSVYSITKYTVRTVPRTFFYVQGGSNMTGTDLCVNSPGHI